MLVLPAKVSLLRHAPTAATEQRQREGSLKWKCTRLRARYNGIPLLTVRKASGTNWNCVSVSKKLVELPESGGADAAELHHGLQLQVQGLDTLAHGS